MGKGVGKDGGREWEKGVGGGEGSGEVSGEGWGKDGGREWGKGVGEGREEKDRKRWGNETTVT